ncbi:MAG: ExbD/TolR family protein [Cyclobacteriaceae bacterium]
MARSTPEIPNASMADIAFLLLTFFLVTTTIANDRGLSLILPPPPEAQQTDEIKIQERNMFKVQLNSADQLLVEGDWMDDVSGLKDQIKEFVLNNGANPNLSDNPQKAIVSFKTDRGTSHQRFVEILNIIQAAYNDIYAERAGVTNVRWREIASDLQDPENSRLYDIGRGKKPDGSMEIPMNISIAEPTKIGG